MAKSRLSWRRTASVQLVTAMAEGAATQPVADDGIGHGHFGLAIASPHVYGDNMSNHDNTVNIKSRLRPYHHGNLRDSLVKAALELIRQQTTDELSLREVARNVGVSATAVYRHFPDKQALLDALCVEGQATLAEAQRVAMAAAGGGQKGFDNTGLAYVRFALANPALFRLMIKSRPSAASAESNPRVAGEALQVLESNVAAILPKKAKAQQRQLRAIHAWSLVHGLTMLILDGRLPHDEKMIEAVIRAPIT